MATQVSGNKRVAILIENQFEDAEFQVPYTALKQAGVETVVLGSRMNDEYTGKRGQVTLRPNATATEVRSEDFDAILIPGGGAPDQIRLNPNAVRLVMNAIAQDKIVAAVCHGPQVLIEADQLQGKQATGYRSIRKDMQNAGATYIDEPVVVDGNLITARQPGDLPLFTTMLLSALRLDLSGEALPELGGQNDSWWQLAEKWGGSSRQDIVNALNAATVGERYTLSAFEKYLEKVSDTELRVILQAVMTTKRQHLALLEQRLSAFDEKVTWQAVGSEAFATLQNWLQASDNMAITRRALGDIQTGVVDALHLAAQLTDPTTVEIFSQIEDNLSRHEQRFADFYRARAGAQVQPPSPTTVAAS
ncbi:DJ-1/PfpI/YhbO family deglycase/protease [Almyronema epifaneia]|uniref:DJ-1/PfpI/YhbO family deglycase/protease n=1 Tax=Almyronema epifaneia S1 TaxID=2991925 RepID=A0ABW6ICY9_9CYAN